MSTLADIVDHKREELSRKKREPLEALRERANAVKRRPLKYRNPLSLIAEVKRLSPSAGDLAPGIDIVQRALAYQRGGASAISVLCDQRYFGGSLEDLAAIRRRVELPVLCKDFIVDPYQVWEAGAFGADLLLLIVAALNDRELRHLHDLAQELGMVPLVEVHDQHDLARAIAMDARLIGINNRNLDDFSVDLVTTEYLAPLVPDDTMIVSESGLATPEDVRRVRSAGAQVVLIGEALMRSSDPETLIRELLA
ncbi:MAG: indole-3-glycerol phosphate synthase TrpC [Chloroflexota bacterium]